MTPPTFFPRKPRSCTAALLSLLIVNVSWADPASLYPLWDSRVPIPIAEDILPLKETRFHVIKRRVPQNDGYNWLHGVALVKHNNVLFSSFGHNRGKENTIEEVANGRVSLDWGEHWSPLFKIDHGETEGLAVSHGVFLSQASQLWAYHGAFYGKMQSVHTRAYQLDFKTNLWTPREIEMESGFWPMQEPQRLGNGTWAMAGLRVLGGVGKDNNPPSVAISEQGNLTKWTLSHIPRPKSLGLWGESTLIHKESHLLCISRYRQPIALVSESHDYGQTWTPLRPSNLPMTASKPYSGRLSTGHAYLIANCAAKNKNQRFPLTIALTKPGGMQFNRLFNIRNAEHQGPGESHPKSALSYPYAIEHQGKLYVGYSNDGGRGANRNSAELAILSIEELTTAVETNGASASED